jgi:hypothetical protein
MPEHMGGEVVRLTFRAGPADVPVWSRVRALLKHAGRTLQLKCVEAVNLTPKLPPLPQALAAAESGETQDKASAPAQVSSV